MRRHGQKPCSLYTIKKNNISSKLSSLNTHASFCLFLFVLLYFKVFINCELFMIFIYRTTMGEDVTEYVFDSGDSESDDASDDCNLDQD